MSYSGCDRGRREDKRDVGRCEVAGSAWVGEAVDINKQVLTLMGDRS